MLAQDVEHLYKFRSLAGPSLDYVARIFLNHELYFARAKNFNDPFDCAPIPSLEATTSEFETYLHNLYKRRMPGMSRSDRRANVDAILKDPKRNHRSKAAIETFRHTMSEVVNIAGVLSLAANFDHVLMWSHYADSHRGICLRFKVDRDSPFFARAQPVIYQAERPVLNLIRDLPHVQMDKALLTKADFWSYKDEWRIIEHEKGPGAHSFPAYLLDGVILGARIAPEHRAKILEWKASRAEPLQILQATFSDRLFRVEVANAT